VVTTYRYYHSLQLRTAWLVIFGETAVGLIECSLAYLHYSSTVVYEYELTNQSVFHQEKSDLQDS
jgi:hypothetical protein